MRRVIGLAFATAALSVPLIDAGLAADMRPAYKAPPPIVAPIPTWQGFYIGGHAGGGWIKDGDSGFIGGGQIGYNWQFAPNWLIGVEGDFTWTDLGQSSTLFVPPGTTLSASANLNWLASVRGRLGYTWDRYMLYFTGGGAWADLDGSATLTVAGVGAASATAGARASGWVIGGGGEWMFAPNWSFGVEYLHYTFDSVSGTVAGPAGTASFNFGSGDAQVDVVRARLNYKFGDLFGR
jgi:outer membrane immunogenic protein